MNEHKQIEQQLLTCADAMQYLNISKRTFYKLIDGGQILQVSIGLRGKRYNINDLNDFIMNNTKAKQKMIKGP